jgi:hypothetical protein
MAAETQAAAPRWVTSLVFVALAIASVAPIRSYDYFWHLAAGRWIVEHHALPLIDPFGVASARVPWIDGEWLFQIIVYGLGRVAGHSGVSIALAIGTAAAFATMFSIVSREIGMFLAAPVIVVSWYGAAGWLRERPSAMGAFALIALLVIMMRTSGWLRVAGVFAVTALWMNMHPSALIAPAVVALYEIGGARDWRTVMASAAALFVNPYGLAGITAPIHLARIVPAFHNEEWSASTPGEFPLFYAVLLTATALYFFGRRRDVSRALVLLLLAVLAIRYCRNQGLFYAALPLLVAGFVRPVELRIQKLAAAAAAIAFVSICTDAYFSAGIDARKFPVAAVTRLRDARLSGNIYTPYSLGGFLIWNFYPERRVVTDGRNELYVEYNSEHALAMRDSRAWHALIRRYDLRLALFDYQRPPMQVIDPRTRRAVIVPAFAVYFPRREWALIAIDRVAMVFARRDAFPPERLASIEIR